MIDARLQKTAVASALGVFIVVILSRLILVPFVPGPDPDAWKLILMSRQLALEGIYEVSRHPGYPAVELLMTVLAKAPLWVYSAFCLFVSAVGATVLYLILAPLVRHAAPLSVGIYAMPMFMIESVSAMDYLFSLTFILGSLHAILRGRISLGGSLLGLAIAARLTSVLFLPGLFLLLLWITPRKQKLRVVSLYLLFAAFVTGLLYALPFSVYGPSFVRFYDQSYPPISTVIYKATSASGGTIISAVIICLFVAAIVAFLRNQKHSDLTRVALSWMLIVTFGLFAVLFVRAPFEGAYLIPCILSIFVFAALWLDKFAVFPIVLVVAISGIYDFIPPKIGPGLVLQTQQEKQTRMARAYVLSEFRSNLQENDVLVAGYLHPMLIAIGPGKYVDSQVFYSINEDSAEKVIQRGGQIFYPEELKEFLENKEVISMENIDAQSIP